MQFFLAALVGALVQMAGTMVGKVLLSLGIGYATYTGVDASIGWAKQQALQSLSGLGSDAIAVMGGMQVGRCISILCSAYLTRLTLNGLSAGGSIKKMVVK